MTAPVNRQLACLRSIHRKAKTAAQHVEPGSAAWEYVNDAAIMLRRAITAIQLGDRS